VINNVLRHGERVLVDDNEEDDECQGTGTVQRKYEFICGPAPRPRSRIGIRRHVMEDYILKKRFAGPAAFAWRTEEPGERQVSLAP